MYFREFCFFDQFDSIVEIFIGFTRKSYYNICRNSRPVENGFNLADYSVLSEWWSHNTYGCRLYIGQAPYRIGRKVTAKEWRTSRDIRMSRKDATALIENRRRK